MGTWVLYDSHGGGNATESGIILYVISRDKPYFLVAKRYMTVKMDMFSCVLRNIVFINRTASV